MLGAHLWLAAVLYRHSPPLPRVGGGRVPPRFHAGDRLTPSIAPGPETTRGVHVTLSLLTIWNIANLDMVLGWTRLCSCSSETLQMHC
jgi:hypothetical protein